MRVLLCMLLVVAVLGWASCGERPAIVRGRVLVPAGVIVDVAPGGNAAIPSVCRADGFKPMDGWFRPEPDGTFAWHGVGSGVLEVRIAINGVEQRTLAIPSIEVAAGADLQPPEWNPIQLANRLRTYEVRALDSNRVPIRDALVVCEPVRDAGFPKFTDARGVAMIVSVDSGPSIGAFLAEVEGAKGSRPKVVIATKDLVEIVLEDRIAFIVTVNQDVRLPANRRFHAVACPINPNATQRKDLGANTQVNETPLEYLWTGFIMNGETLDDRRKATIGLPWAGHYALVLYVSEAEDEDLRCRVVPKWIKFVLDDSPGQALAVSVTQAQVDAALKDLDQMIESVHRVTPR